MKRSTIKQSAILVVAALVLTAPINQAAAFSMDDMVNEYTASTVDPNSRVSLDGRRGFVSGGSLRVRFQNKSNPELYNVTLPSFKADCNGMDMNLGSLSWISADEFMDAARAMASPQVLIYALSLALNQMCGPCAQMMSDLQDKMNKYSGLLKQSCEQIGTALYKKSGAKEYIADNELKFWGPSQEETGDDAAATEGNATQNMLDAGKQAQVSKNIVWDHMTNEDDAIVIGGWLEDVAGEDIARQMVMSMSGTLIMDARNASNVDEIISTPKQPVEISLTDIINGGEIEGLVCSGEEYDKCLTVNKGVLIDEEPLAKQFYDMLDPENGIPSKFSIHYDGIDLSNDELAFMEAAQRHFDIQHYMYSLAMEGNKMPERTAAIIAEKMAIEIALEFMTSYVNTAAVVIEGVDNQDDIEPINPFEKNAGYRKEAETLREELAERIESDANLSQILRNAVEQ